MKKSFFLLLAASLICSALFAQKTYPKEWDEYEDWDPRISFKGTNPTIVDFVNNFLAEPEDELSGGLSDMWTKYRKGKPQDKGDTVIVDIRNGYVCFKEHTDDEYSKTYAKTEICYWNCSDGKHKVVAFSHDLWSDGRWVEGQYSGLTFFVYNNAKRRMTMASNTGEELGVVVKTGREGEISGYDSSTKMYFAELDGKRTNMTEEEYNKFVDERPVVTISLPRTGKTLKAIINTPSTRKEVLFQWDGMYFHPAK